MIHIQQLTKRFDATHGIFDVSLDVSPGMIFGFIGPNGAGKSTTIRHLMGLLKPNEGNASINGFDCWQETEKVKQCVGYLPGEINYPQNMTGEEIIHLTRHLHKTDAERERNLRERFSFDEATKVRKMSKGMKQKLAIITCFMKDVPVYILDEPTSGLDPLMQERLIDWLIEEKQSGKAILMSSHHFPEMERTCDRAALIKDGRIIIEEDIEELRQHSVKRYRIEFSSEPEAIRFAEDSAVRDGLQVEVVITKPEDLNRLIRTLANYEIRSLASGADELEHLFMQYYGEAT
ncbi:ABC transporter ATP-binding protein [Exiguobacterium qingdaonense]|uniref:ABC transporter ATP-binding protein n=1 Tax=Exiguobacterium qingdaonense TaxID=2751251 RepID=UPI001BEC6D3F|nr:ATP-binding cassette domain-containing protein [Exiguobacterium qingdaonense]